MEVVSATVYHLGALLYSIFTDRSGKSSGPVHHTIGLIQHRVQAPEMWTALVTIPLQIVCQLVIPGKNGTADTPFVVDTQSLGAPNYGLRSPEPVLPEGYKAYPDIGVAYKYHTDSMSWNAARKACIAEGSSLAELDTFQKIQYAIDLKQDNDKYGLAVGIHRFFDNAEWTSLKTGLGVSMIPWGSVSNDETERFKCMFMYYDGRGLLADQCTDEYRFLCEIPLPVK